MKVISVNNLYKEYQTGIIGFKSLLKDDKLRKIINQEIDIKEINNIKTLW